MTDIWAYTSLSFFLNLIDKTEKRNENKFIIYSSYEHTNMTSVLEGFIFSQLKAVKESQGLNKNDSSILP